MSGASLLGPLKWLKGRSSRGVGLWGPCAGHSVANRATAVLPETGCWHVALRAGWLRASIPECVSESSALTHSTTCMCPPSGKRSEAVQRRAKWFAATAGSVTGLILSVGAPGMAHASAGAPEPVPSCVEMHESWRYTTAVNNCADSVSVRVVYSDGATGPCLSLPSGTFSTVGEGYFGAHGHADRLELCRPS
ncbi:hypothetical protein [Streptomyces minutiscleroticus]|uniref:hypothetical protein n=1 Tax=Streptomyces minutiscleroticus TaxID=68238 RepID=UPI00331BB95A